MGLANPWVWVLCSSVLSCWACVDESAAPSSARGDIPSVVSGSALPNARAAGDADQGSDTEGSATTARDLPGGNVEVSETGVGNYGEDLIGYRNAPGEGPGPVGGGAGGAGALPAPSLSILRPLDSETGNVVENPYAESEEPSTFSIDVDTASYTWSRAAVEAGDLPPQDMVRVEEFINYFDFHYEPPTGDDPLSVYTELGQCPWNTAHDLLLVGVQGAYVDFSDSPPAHLVFLVDVSGSMAEELDLVRAGLRSLTYALREQDQVSIVTYAGTAAVALEAARGTDTEAIFEAIDRLTSGGSTAGAAGIRLAYDLAREHFIEGGTNRVLLATDGDFNVGISSTGELSDFIAQERESGVFLSVYGFGMSASGDAVAETLADDGNGIYAYIDGPAELKRAFGHALSGSLITVASDVKLQVSFNPEHVKGYRLIGYENRLLTEDLFYELIDAGDLGSGLSSTALFEIIPAGASEELPDPIDGTVPEILTVEGEQGSTVRETPTSANEPEEAFATVRLRYFPSGETSERQDGFWVNPDARHAAPTMKFRFAAGISHFAMRLRGSQYLGEYAPEALLDQLQSALPLDQEGAVAEAVDFVRLAHEL